MAGGTFTISNGGVFGSLYGTPIINLPQSAVLGESPRLPTDCKSPPPWLLCCPAPTAITSVPSPSDLDLVLVPRVELLLTTFRTPL